MKNKLLLPAVGVFAVGVAVGLVADAPRQVAIVSPAPKPHVTSETRVRAVSAHLTRNGVSHPLRPLSVRRGDAVESLNPPTQDAAPTVIRVQAVVDGAPVLLVFESPDE